LSTGNRGNWSENQTEDAEVCVHDTQPPQQPPPQQPQQQQEQQREQHQQQQPQRTAPRWTGKTPVSLLHEFTQKRKWTKPQWLKVVVVVVVCGSASVPCVGGRCPNIQHHPQHQNTTPPHHTTQHNTTQHTTTQHTTQAKAPPGRYRCRVILISKKKVCS